MKITGSSKTLGAIIQRPSFTDSLKFPEDLTQLETADTSKLLGRYTLLHSYAAQAGYHHQVQRLKLDTEERLRRLELIRKQPSLNAQEKWRRDTVLDTDKRIMEITAEKSKVEEELKAAEFFMGVYDKYIQALSRELSRKMNDAGQQFNQHMRSTRR